MSAGVAGDRFTPDTRKSRDLHPSAVAGIRDTTRARRFKSITEKRKYISDVHYAVATEIGVRIVGPERTTHDQPVWTGDDAIIIEVSIAHVPIAISVCVPLVRIGIVDAVTYCTA